MKKILVIDDENSIRLLLKKMLEREGFDVMTASDGKEGMDIISKAAFDLVITDIVMPEKEGIEIIMELKKGYPDIPIIAISGGGIVMPEIYLDLAEKLGAVHTFSKPIDKETLVSTIKEILS